MPSINKDNPRYLAPFVCLDCRRSFKRPFDRDVTHRPCPVCGQPAIALSQKFKPPKASDDEQWAKVRFLVEHGYLFQSIYDGHGRPVPYPATLKQARAWIKRRSVKAALSD